MAIIMINIFFLAEDVVFVVVYDIIEDWEIFFLIFWFSDFQIVNSIDTNHYNSNGMDFRMSVCVTIKHRQWYSFETNFHWSFQKKVKEEN